MTLDLPDSTMAAVRAAQALVAEHDLAGAKAAYRDLLVAVGDDDYQAAAVLHMYALVVDDPTDKLAVNHDALERAERSGRFPPPLYASLYANIGYSLISLGQRGEARQWYLKAKAAAADLDHDSYGTMVRAGIDNKLASLSC